MHKLKQFFPAVAWALAIIVVAFVFRGTPAALPLVSAVTGIAFILILPGNRNSCSR